MSRIERVLIIGGAGAIGTALTRELLTREACVDIIDIQPQYRFSDPAVKEIQCDRSNSAEFSAIITELCDSNRSKWSLIVDCALFFVQDTDLVLGKLMDMTERYILLSSSMLSNGYNASNWEALGEGYRYLTEKSRIESKLLKSNYLNWSIVRSYHVLGALTLPGCTPPHNRDPELFQKIRSSIPIQLINGGENQISYISPADLARVIADSKDYPLTQQVFDVCNPDAVRVIDYYQIIADQMSIRPVFEHQSFIPSAHKGTFWEQTLVDQIHGQEVRQMKLDIRDDLVACINQAFELPPNNMIAGINQRHSSTQHLRELKES